MERTAEVRHLPTRIYPDDDYEFGKPVDADLVIWNRERVSAAQDGIVNEISGADLFIFGHTPAHQPSQYANQMYIDTGAVFCGRLTLVQIRGAIMRSYVISAGAKSAGQNYPQHSKTTVGAALKAWRW